MDETTRTFLKILPYRLSLKVEGYIRSVEEAVNDIANEADIKMSSKLKDDFVFWAAVRNVYSLLNNLVSFQYSVSEFAEKKEFSGFSVGSQIYNGQATEEVLFRKIKLELERLLVRNNAYSLVRASSLTDLMRMVGERGQ